MCATIAAIREYEQAAAALFLALSAGDDDAQWRVKWQHPRFRGKSVDEVRAATLGLADAQAVVAREHGFDAWEDLQRFTQAVAADGPAATFEKAVEAVVSGDVATLRSMLAKHPDLAKARSSRRHRATLLHYLAANGVEQCRQRTPANALEVMKTLLDAGADVDALADMYDSACTTMSMLVSSSHPAEAGLQAPLAEMLLDHGAKLDGPGSHWQSALMTALIFGFLDTARALAKRGARVDTVAAAAGLGRAEDVARLLPGSEAQDRHRALALAAQLGHADAVRLLLDAGEDPDRLNPDGLHSHATPLHHAALGGHLDVVKLMVERGARLDIRDTIFDGTPLGWALHNGQTAVAEYLRGRGGGGESTK